MKNGQSVWLAAAVLGGIQGWAAVQQPAAATSAQPSTSASARSTQQLPQVTIEARRELESRGVRKFVNGIAVQESDFDAGLARWRTPPVCPLVSGLSRQHGE